MSLQRSIAGGHHPEITLPYRDEWELYHNSFSLCSKKLRVCMAELELNYTGHPVHLIETGRYENVGRDFLAINPAGTVPVIVHKGHPVYESHDQIVYLAEHAGTKGERLLPGDDEPEVRALVEHWTDCASLKGNAIQGGRERAGHCIPGLTIPIFAAMVRYIPYSEIFKGLLTHPNKERPVLFTLLKTLGVTGAAKLPPILGLLTRSRQNMERHLDTLAALLDSHGGPWIAGERFTLADVSWVVILDRLVEVDWEEVFWGGGKRPTIAAYWRRLANRPSYQSEILAARCEITRKGIADVRRAKQQNPALRRALEGG